MFGPCSRKRLSHVVCLAAPQASTREVGDWDMTNRTGALAGLTAAALLLAGCAASQQARDVSESGFLGNDYALLREGKEGEALLVYRNPDAAWSSYDKIKLDPVTIWAGEESAFEDFSKPERQELADTLYTMLAEELSQDFQMVDELGPGVLQVARLADRWWAAPRSSGGLQGGSAGVASLRGFARRSPELGQRRGHCR
jgi:hypothetical protein